MVIAHIVEKMNSWSLPFKSTSNFRGDAKTTVKTEATSTAIIKSMSGPQRGTS